MIDDARAHRSGERRHRVHLVEERTGAWTFLSDETEGLRDVVVNKQAEGDARVEAAPSAAQVLAADLPEVERARERLAQREDGADLGVADRALGMRALQ